MPTGGGYRRLSGRMLLPCLLTLAVGGAAALPAAAATNSLSFSVSATVVAACSIPVQAGSTARHAATFCSRPSGSSTIAAPSPLISTTRDTATGLITKTVEF